MTSTVYIVKNVYGGDGLGRLGDGRVIFVPGAFAGEQVKAEIVEERRSFVKARLVEIVEPSSERTGTAQEPVPGMVYANLSAKGELAAKEAQLREALDRARLVRATDDSIIKPMAQSPRLLNYRNKAVYHFSVENSKHTHSNTVIIGYMREPEHTIQDVTNDPLVRQEINNALPGIRNHVTALLTQGSSVVRRSIEAKGNVTVRWSIASGVKWWIGIAPPDVTIKENSLGKVFETPSDGFWQVNPEVGEILTKAVVNEYARGKDVAPELIDLYCGVGVLGLSCNAPKLVGVESGRQAIEYAKRNAVQFPGTASRFFADKVGNNMRKMRIYDTTTIIIDPPRSGLERGVAAFLAGSRAKRIIYAACDPATMVRDLRDLSRTFKIASVASFNMFPRTARFESLVTLCRK